MGQAVSEGQRVRMLENWVRQQVSIVLGVQAPALVSGKVFQDLGMTSLSAMELCSQLETGLGLNLAPTLMYNYPTLDLLVPYLAARLDLAREQHV